MTLKIKKKTMLLLYAIAAILFFIFLIGYKWVNRSSHKNTLTVQTFQTSIGWGYRIENGKRILINQPFIPVIETHTGFDSRETAEKVGQIVVSRLEKHQDPILTIQDLINAGVKVHDRPIIPNPTN